MQHTLLVLALVGLTSSTAQRLRGMAHGEARAQMRQRRHERNSRLRHDHLNHMALVHGLSDEPEDRNVTTFQAKVRWVCTVPYRTALHRTAPYRPPPTTPPPHPTHHTRP